jgi:NAD(P)-dependent dehydrogenase (short-subunit alcohol dehydrogenase family)
MRDLKGTVVVVTGGARGMGREYVRGLAAEGANVVAVDLSWEPTGFSGDDDASFYEWFQGQKNILPLTADITRDDQITAAYQRTLEAFGTVDALINNAGMRGRDLFPPVGMVTILETTRSDWQRMYESQVFGTVEMTRTFIQPMLEKGSGSIVNVVSGGAWGGRPDSMEQPYMSAKAAIVNLSFYLAHEVKPKNVAVNVLVPGHTRTTGFDELQRIRMDEFGRRGSTAVRADHVVPLGVFLARQDASEGLSGKAIYAMEWNLLHGYGGFDAWVAPYPDL